MGQRPQGGRKFRSRSQIDRGCTSKMRYGTSRQAEKAAARVAKREGYAISFYPCLRCGGWHLTSSI